jgi:hypothetical protein
LVYEGGLSKISKTFGVDVEFLGFFTGVVSRKQFGEILVVTYFSGVKVLLYTWQVFG